MQTDATLLAMPLVAILRGVEPTRAADVAEVLFDAGIRVIEVPMNSPDAFASIARIAAALGSRCLIGGGTVLDTAQVEGVFAAGGRIVVAPNTSPAVIAATLKRSMIPMPGFATATEAFTAIAAGAVHLKLFPASTHGPAYLKALKTVLPKTVHVHAVGSVGADDVAQWVEAGAAGFGFGSELFKPSYSMDDIAARARRLVQAVKSALPER